MDTCNNCGCEPEILDCWDRIACSQMKVAECEAKLFCEVVSRLGCEIRHARCLRDLEQLIRLTNSFLNASAVKEKALAEVLTSIGEPKETVLCG